MNFITRHTSTIALLLLCLGFSQQIFAQKGKTQEVSEEPTGIQFFHGTFDEALAEAQATGKVVFMDAYTTWCGPCKMMARNTFPNEAVGEFFNENFISIKVDMEKGEGKTLARTYRVRAYPTLLFINPDGELRYQTIGYHKPGKLLDVAKLALERE